MGVPSVAPKPDLSQPGLDQLADEIECLKRRISALEQLVSRSAPDITPVSSAVLPALNLNPSAGAVVLLGKALLGIAGAYFLRALVEASILPRPLGIALGMLYSAAWLCLAARTPKAQRFAGALDACASILIFVPLLWEATMRFRVVPLWAAALLISFYAAFGIILSWIYPQPLTMRLALTGSAIAAIAFLIAGRDLLPFALALLGMAAATEILTCLHQRVDERWVVAACSDLSIVIFAYIATRKPDALEGYSRVSWQAALALGAALAMIYVASSIAVLFTERERLGLFEIVQLAVALTIAVVGGLKAAQGNTLAVSAIGILALLAAICGYLLGAAPQAGVAKFNSKVFQTFAWALMVTGATLLFSGVPLILAFCAIAINCSWISHHSDDGALKLHAAAYIALAAFASRLPMLSLNELFGGGNQPYPALVCGILLVTGAVCYAPAIRGRSSGWQALSPMVVAATLAWIMAGAVAHTVSLAGAFAASGTGVLMALSLVLAWMGVRWHRAELVWLVYTLMALGAYKLLTRDLVQERSLPLLLSLLFFGSTLILLARILQNRNSPAR